MSARIRFGTPSAWSKPTKRGPVVVRFEVEGDENASRIAALLGALGYQVERAQAGPLEGTLDWRIGEMVRRAKLTLREAEVLEHIVTKGESLAELSKVLNVSRPTAKWHLHNILAKTAAPSVRGLLEQLLGVRRA